MKAPKIGKVKFVGGSSAGGFLTSDNTLRFEGKGTPKAKITIFDNGKKIGTAKVDKKGKWSFDSKALPDGAHSFTAKAKLGKDASPASKALKGAIDATAPSAPSAPDLDAASDTGSSNADNLTNVTTPTLSGTAEAGATVTIKDGATVLGTVVAHATTGAWSFTTAALSNGAHSLTATATDTAGNAGPASAALVVTIDATAPSAPSAPDLGAASDSGSSSTDNLTNDTTPTLTGTAEAGATVTIKDGATVLGTVVAHATTGAWSFTTGALSNGAHSLTATATDTAGNTSAASSALGITIDTAAPASPSVALAAGSDTGASASDNLTNDTTPTLTGTAEAGSTVTVRDGPAVLGTTVADSLGQWSFTTTALSPGVHGITATATDVAGNSSAASSALLVTIDTVGLTATIVVADSALKAGETSLVAIAFSEAVPDLEIADFSVQNGVLTGLSTSNGGITWTATLTPTASITDTSNVIALANSAVIDAAGNAGTGTSTSNNYAIDTVRPTVTSIVVADTALKAGETSLVTITFSEAVTGLTTADLAVANGAVSAPSSSDGGITWTATLTPTASTTDASNVITLANSGVVNGAGNTGTGTTTSNNYAIDTAPPAAPVISGYDEDTGAIGDGWTTDDVLLLTGTAEAGATVSIFDGGFLGTAVADGDGDWEFETGALGRGDHSFTATATDAAGNTGVASAPLAVQVGYDDIALASFAPAAGLRIFGAEAGDHSGFSVASAGDVNGDGLADVIVGARSADGDGNGQYAGESYVIFGKAAGLGDIDLLSPLSAADGFRIFGADGGDRSATSVASAGDVNGDGFDDVIIGAPRAWSVANGRAYAGEAIVVFGKASGIADVDVYAANFVTSGQGFRILGANSHDYAGTSVSSAGDVNGDGFADMIVGARGVDDNGRIYSGTSYVVFGKATGFIDVDLASLAPTAGFRIFGANSTDKSGVQVASAGDINGDGFDDMIIAAELADGAGRNQSGEAIVVFGKASGFVDLDVASSAFVDDDHGFRIFGVSAFDRLNRVASAGDFNGDGFADMILGAPERAGFNGESYVLFGKATGLADIDLLSSPSLAPNAGFRIISAGAEDMLGSAVSSAGDINGDGFDDLIVGAKHTDGANRAGDSYVLFGKADGIADVFLGALAPAAGFRIFGADVDDRAGYSVAAAGDVNGDGFDDMIVGAWKADSVGNGRPDAGESYVLYGGAFGGSLTPVTTTGSGIAEILIGGAGDDVLSGGGGTDVIRSGAGDDLVTVADLAFRKVDGGSGTDTLVLAGLDVDFTGFADNRVEGIEALDVTGSGADTIVLGALDALNFSDTPNADFTGAGSHKNLVVYGDGVDTLDLRDFDPDGGGGAAPYLWQPADSARNLAGTGPGGFDFYNLMRGSEVIASVAVDADMDVLLAP